MPTSNTNSTPDFSYIISQIQADIMDNSMEYTRQLAERESNIIDEAASSFFGLFSHMVLDTNQVPSLGEYTPAYAAYTKKYKDYKNTEAPSRGWFSFSGQLKDDVESLRSQTNNILGRSSTWIELSNSGLKKGFKVVGNGSIVSLKNNRFVKYSEALKDFKATVHHKPFSKLEDVLKPKLLEKQLFSQTHRDIYIKLANIGGNGRTYRSGFYSYMNWWLNVFLTRKLNEDLPNDIF